MSYDKIVLSLYEKNLWIGLLAPACELHWLYIKWQGTGLILGLRPANERRRYFVTASLIDWAQT